MYRNYVDISVAVSSPNGLVVPVLRNVEDMGESFGLGAELNICHCTHPPLSFVVLSSVSSLVRR